MKISQRTWVGGTILCVTLLAAASLAYSMFPRDPVQELSQSPSGFEVITIQGPNGEFNSLVPTGAGDLLQGQNLVVTGTAEFTFHGAIRDDDGTPLGNGPVTIELPVARLRQASTR